MSDTQKLYWQETATLKRDARYVDLYLAKTEVTDRYIKAFLAVASSSSIGGWIVFQQYAFVWASIVATSQVLQLVKEYLPYKTRMKSLSVLSSELNALSLTAEEHWFHVSRGELYDDDIHDLRFELKKKKMSSVQKAFPVAGLPEDKKIFARAEKEAAEYFASYSMEDS